MDLIEILDGLAETRRSFGRRAASRKRGLLRRARRVALDDARGLVAYHEALLFLVAYPDDALVRSAAEAELRRCAEAARRLVDEGPRREAKRLDDTGVAHTRSTCVYTIDTARWLSDRFGRAVDVAWEDDALGPGVDELLPALVSTVEGDGTRCRDLTTRDWFRIARGGAGTDLAWLLGRLDRIAATGPALDRIFDALDVRLRWRLSGRGASRTFQRFPARPVCHHADGLERQVRLADWIDRPLPPAGRLPVARGERLVDLARAVLSVRHRETDPVTYADPREVYLVRLERGFDLALYGMRPDRRLPIESFFGYLLAKNRVPMAYGGGWVFLDRCEIGINVFETFRGGESSLAFAQIMRVYRGLFRAKRFTVDPFQFGASNPDAIRSGAFWFYYRFGFRPTDARLRALAEREWARLDADRGHRTAPATLRRFAAGNLEYVVDPADDPGEAPPDLVDLGLAVTRAVGRAYGADRADAERVVSRRLARRLGAGDTARWPEPERRAFAALALLADRVPDLERWPDAARRALVRLLRAKGGPSERVYALALQRHRAFREALAAIARDRK